MVRNPGNAPITFCISGQSALDNLIIIIFVGRVTDIAMAHSAAHLHFTPTIVGTHFTRCYSSV